MENYLSAIDPRNVDWGSLVSSLDPRNIEPKLLGDKAVVLVNTYTPQFVDTSFDAVGLSNYKGMIKVALVGAASLVAFTFVSDAVKGLYGRCCQKAPQEVSPKKTQ